MNNRYNCGFLFNYGIISAFEQMRQNIMRHNKTHIQQMQHTITETPKTRKIRSL